MKRRREKANRRVSLGGFAPVLYGSQSSPLQTMERKGSPTAQLRTHYTKHPVPSTGGWCCPPRRSTVEASHPSERGLGGHSSPASAARITPALLHSGR